MPTKCLGCGRLYDFEEVDTGGAITAKVWMDFELIDRENHKSVWSHFYSHTQPVQAKEIPVVVASLDRNLEQGLSEVESGLDSYFTSHLPQQVLHPKAPTVHQKSENR